MSGHREKKRRAAVAFLLCGAFLLGNMAVYADEQAQNAATRSSSSSYQDQIDSINDKLKELKQREEELSDSLEDTQSEIEQEQIRRTGLYEQIQITKGEIELLLERIALYEADIGEKERQIADKQASIDETYALFLQRLRAMYMTDDATVLGLILGADSFSEFLTHTDTVVRIADHDQALMQLLTDERIELEDQKAALEQRKAELEEDRRLTEEKEEQLGAQMAAAELRIHDMEQMEREFLADLEKNKAMQDAMQAELADIYRRIEWSKNPYIGGVMEWPLPGYYKITSEFGSRFGGTNNHTGMDIAGTGVYSANIIAANAGTVAFTNWSYTPNVGYGIYVILDHGGGITTLYAHCSSLSVQVGDPVVKGQKIAEVGSTGWSTGPHLHFEVRINGTPVNPRQYVIGNA